MFMHTCLMRNRGLKCQILVVVLMVPVVLVACTAVEAAEQTTNSLDTIVNLFKGNASKWEETLTNYAKSLFWLLATIEMAYMGIRLVLRAADVAEWATELVNQILFIGFFYALLTHSSVWANAIVQSFRTAANQAVAAAGGTPLIAPSDVFAIGLNMANTILDKQSWNPIAAAGVIIFALILVWCYAEIAAFLVVALVESYIAISAGVLFMGFGGSRWTKDFAIKVIMYAMSAGAKLFVLQLIIGMGQQLFNTLIQNFSGTTNDILVSIGCALGMRSITKIIPDLIQALVNGATFGAQTALIGAARGAGSGTWESAKGIYGAGIVGGGAYKLASEQMRESQASGSMGYGRALRMVGNVASAAVDTFALRLSGRSQFGSWASQMADSMRERRIDKQAESLTRDQASGPDGTVSGAGTGAGRGGGGGNSGPGTGGPGSRRAP